MADEDWREIYTHWRPKIVERSGDPDRFEKEFWANGCPTQAFRDLLRRTAEDLYQKLAQDSDAHGVTCFSEKVDDLLMWSHYSQGHTGFCLEFDTSFDPFSKLHQVIYRDELPRVRMAQLLQADAMELLVEMLMTKYTCWAYEKEWRVIHREGNKEYIVDWRALTGVYFGCEMSKVHKEVIALILAESPTQLYEMAQDETRFAVHPVATDYHRFDYKEGDHDSSAK